MEPMTPTALKKLRVVDLKEKLSALGLPLNGLKADLINRLLDYFSSQAQMRTEPAFNVVQQPHPPSLPAGQPGLIHGESSYSMNQTQHQLQLDAHIQHNLPSPSYSSPLQHFVPTHIPHNELPTNFSSQVNPLSPSNELATHHTHQSYQSHPSLQSHQSHQSHQAHQLHQVHQAHQSHQSHQALAALQALQAHQSHQMQSAHHYHEPPSSLMHPTPSVIESSHIKMPSDDPTHFFDNSSHNQRRSSQSHNQPLQSTSSIDLSSHIAFTQEKSNARDCQAINQSQSAVSVDTLPIKHSDLPAVFIDQTQNPMIQEEPDDNQVNETPQKAIFDLENLLHEALKANQPIDLSVAEPCKDNESLTEQISASNEDRVTEHCRDDENISEDTSPTNEDHVIDPRRDNENLSEDTSATTAERVTDPISYGNLPERTSSTIEDRVTEPCRDNENLLEHISASNEDRVTEPCRDYRISPERTLPTNEDRVVEPISNENLQEHTSPTNQDSIVALFTDDENLQEKTSPTNEDCFSVSDIDKKAIGTFEKSESTPEPEACLENEQLKVEIQLEPERNSDDQEASSLITTEQENQRTETSEDTFIETSPDRHVDTERFVTDSELKQTNNDMETSYELQQTPVDTIEVGAEANQSQMNQIKTTNETETVPDQNDTNIIFNANQSDILSASEPNACSSPVVQEQPVDNQFPQEEDQEKDLSYMDISNLNDQLDTPVIPSVNETKLTNKIDTESNRKLTKNAKKKLRKKKKKAEKSKVPPTKVQEKPLALDGDDDIEIEYVEDEVIHDPIYFQYVKIFEKFKGSDVANNEPNEDYSDIIDPAKKMHERKKPVELELKEEDEKNDGEPKISKRKLKQLTRMTVADLKQKVSHPELVEMHDVTARDPLLLLNLKSTRNSVPVPRHWCFKRKYLQGKRGFEKPPFKLPEFIRKTGIMEMRQALQEKEDAKSLKTKQREKIRPKLGKIDIDYQKLHDAFFKWSTKPRMTIHGDIYYEGKEFETRLKEKKPGDLSVDLRVALGMPTGPNAHKCPPPWLIAMQRYGPPPSYPNLKIPGLNARIPDGCSFGYHAGGWGKPPVDEYGRPLYGDVFGLSSAQDSTNAEEDVDQSLWGEMESEEEEEEEEEDDDSRDPSEKPSDREADESGIATPSEGLATPSGFASISNGMETPDIIELRKRKIEAEMESNDNPALYTIIPEKKNDGIGKEMMGSTHVYDVSGSVLKKGQGIEVALDPNDLELPVAGLTAKYEQTLKEQQAHLAKEDLSDMVAEHAARQKRKKTQDTSKTNKKYKDFKF